MSFGKIIALSMLGALSAGAGYSCNDERLCLSLPVPVAWEIQLINAGPLRCSRGKDETTTSTAASCGYSYEMAKASAIFSSVKGWRDCGAEGESRGADQLLNS